MRQDSAYRQQDLNNYNREKAALKQAGLTNLFGGLSTLGAVGIAGAAGIFEKDRAAQEKQNRGTAATINTAQVPLVTLARGYR